MAIALQMGLAACDAAPSDAQPPQAASSPAASTREPLLPAPLPNATLAPRAGDREEPGHYTSLAPAGCKVIDTDEEAGGSTSICPGMGGYKLRVLDGDARMSIDVIAPDGGRHPLDLWTVASGAFSSLGPRAEWRFAADDRAPTALIVRFEAYEFPEQPEPTTSYLLVARLAGKDTCLTARIAPGSSQNLRAREAADRAAGAPCLRPDA
jgi:hypothetical protein